MRFPGQRIAKHYFPVTKKAVRIDPDQQGEGEGGWCVLGLDQVLVDVEVHTPADFAEDMGLISGESIQLSERDCQRLLQRLDDQGISCRYAPGGTVANTLNNYVFLSGESAVLLGAIESCIRPGQPAFHFVAQTPKGVDLTHLVSVEGSVGTAITLIDPSGERSFAVAPGISNTFGAAHLDEEVIATAACVLASLYPLEDPRWPIHGATLSLMAKARDAGVPVAFGLGTARLVRKLRAQVQELLQEYVTVAAMNDREAEALTGHAEAELACQKVLDWVDLAIVTQGSKGMTIGGYVDEAYKRQTRQPIRSKAIPEYNRWEYSRLMRREDCDNPIKIYTHIHPYRGGPDQMANTNGAGDAALAAVLHDMTANRYHRAMVPDSEKHVRGPFLTYSSLSRIAQYGNRVAYEVLKGFSPRLDGPVGSDKRDPRLVHVEPGTA